MDMPVDERTDEDIEAEIQRILAGSNSYEMAGQPPLWKLVLGGCLTGGGLTAAGILLVHAIMQAVH
jgi:hypothetical protein